MSPIKKRSTPEQRAAFLEQVLREKAARGQTYREQALKLYPHFCGRCGRDFAGKDLRELTVHHRDNNHHNNPADGSNWELLCVACHDTVHQEGERQDLYGGKPSSDAGSLGHNPFGNLKLPESD